MSYGYDVRRGRDGGYRDGRPEGGGSRNRAHRDPSGEDAPIVKVIEVLAQSPHSWEDAAQRAVQEASRTIRDIKSIYVKDMQALVDDDHIVSFRINAKVSFAVDHGDGYEPPRGPRFPR